MLAARMPVCGDGLCITLPVVQPLSFTVMTGAIADLVTCSAGEPGETLHSAALHGLDRTSARAAYTPMCLPWQISCCYDDKAGPLCCPDLLGTVQAECEIKIVESSTDSDSIGQQICIKVRRAGSNHASGLAS